MVQQNCDQVCANVHCKPLATHVAISEQHHRLIRFCTAPFLQACRNYAKAISAAKEQGMSEGSYTVMHLDLASLDSVCALYARHTLQILHSSRRVVEVKGRRKHEDLPLLAIQPRPC